MTELFTINEDYVPPEILRIKKFYQNILIRALADLRYPKGTKIRREVTQWFDTWINLSPHGVSFKDICEILEFTKEQVKALELHAGVIPPEGSAS